ncbi:MAG: cytochrome P450 [Actinophytocola sp.]|uniref:cytochrome P450 n=1 Tax=Actinophytocola sp. TaxID=1872138 RepID=UPI003C789E49
MTAQIRDYPFSQSDRLDVDPLFAVLRKEEPLCRVQMPYGEPAWFATRYADVRTVLGDARFSRAAATGRDQPRVRAHVGPPGNIMSLDPPDHSRLRRLVMSAFTMRRVEALRPRAQEVADGLVDRMIADGAPAELVEGFALPLPITVICELLGVPVEDRRDFRVWSDAFLSTTRFTPQEVMANVGKLREYMAGLIADRRRAARDDLISALVIARDEGDRLSEDELLSMAEAILVAGHETTASQIPNFVYVLLHNPAHLDALRENPDLVPKAVEELMRWVPLGIGGSTARYATEDVELGGVTVRAGEPVVVAMNSANRDETVFPDPDVIDFGRTDSPHVGFGYGPHHCLGAPLARMELQVALRTLITRLPGLRVAGTDDDVVWKSGLATRAPEHFPVAWD